MKNHFNNNLPILAQGAWARNMRRGLAGLGLGLAAMVGFVSLPGCVDAAPEPVQVVSTDLVTSINAESIVLLEGTVFPLPAGAFAAATPEATTLSFSSIRSATLAPGASEATVVRGSPTYFLQIGGSNPKTVTGTVAFGSCIIGVANPNGGLDATRHTFTMNPCDFKVDSAGKRIGTETVANISGQLTITSPSGEKTVYNSTGKPISGFKLEWVTDANGFGSLKLSYQAGFCVAPGGCGPLRGSESFNGSGNVNLPNSTLAKLVARFTVVTVTGGG